MDVVGIDMAVVERSARVLKHHAKNITGLDLYDERFYPPRNGDPEAVARYFIAMVAIDHRLSRPGKQYSACLEDGCYKGADLLYRLGMKIFMEDRDFFSPERLSVITIDDVKKRLTVGEASPPDPDVRAFLLRDLGLKLVKLYDGSVLKLIERCGGKLRGSIENPGFIDCLKVFRAYEDPVEKKAMLLAKFLIRRGLLEVEDQLEVAVDNHLTRIALRLGLVMVSGSMWDKIKSSTEFTWEEDVILRMIVRRAYRYLSLKSGIPADVVDDFFWIMGRSICLRDEQPLCEKCLFKGFCKAKKNSAFMVREHVYYNTWYY